MLLEKVLSGGQTGADQAAWRAAKAVGLQTGGWMPKGFLTEDGPRPEFAELYGAQEHRIPSYPPRTRANVHWADATIIFDATEARLLEEMSSGTKLAVRFAMEDDKPILVIPVRLGSLPFLQRLRSAADWLIKKEVRILNVGGNRESKAPGIGAFVETHLTSVFRLLESS